ncbi:aminodeoxychorismate lyase [Paenibacillus sp. GCM10012307]|uniref:Aminodeoxychorismate lyase n=1 Tax=Paenibacillus roseus TaxID=2798579 RepID=A0A934IXU3_9BACL|nr:aminodeoxychorismate lyase [Paenibacillus roseus]MBJ6361247.1 aminodeoxychorismate lyase [Paenibacillus roseus]
MKVGFNGAILDAQEAVISVYDHGFLYGLGLFETFRTYGGRPFLLEWHLERLAQACRELGIRYHPDEEHLIGWLRELMNANGLEEAYVRLTVSAGEEELGLPTGDYFRPNVVLLVKPLPLPSPKLDREGKELRLLRTPRNTPEGETRYKSLHYMNNIVAKRELSATDAPPGTEGLMCTRDGCLAEGIVSNLFFVREGKLCTPAVQTGILPGITRRKVLELASNMGIPAEEGLYTWSNLLQAEEVLLTNSVQELVPVTKLTDTKNTAVIVSGGESGRLTQRLLAAYREQAHGRKAETDA